MKQNFRQVRNAGESAILEMGDVYAVFAVHLQFPSFRCTHPCNCPRSMNQVNEQRDYSFPENVECMRPVTFRGAMTSSWAVLANTVPIATPNYGWRYSFVDLSGTEVALNVSIQEFPSWRVKLSS